MLPSVRFILHLGYVHILPDRFPIRIEALFMVTLGVSHARSTTSWCPVRTRRNLLFMVNHLLGPDTKLCGVYIWRHAQGRWLGMKSKFL